MEETQGNPEIGMQADSLDAAEARSDSGSENFFSDLDDQVNGGIVDTEATPIQESGPEQVTRANNEEGSNRVAEQSNRGTDWEKRYTDSSREAVKWRDRYQEGEQFVPVLDAMKNDSGLVDHVRNYLVQGGEPAKSIQNELKLDEDFVFDQQEAMTDPDSDSAKLMNAHVDKLVQSRVGEMVETEQQRAQQIYIAKQKELQEAEFKAKHNMNEEQFEAFKADAKQHVMTLDDINVILNQNKVAKNVASNTKQEMMDQMRNVRNIPKSASGANSQGETVSEERDVFNSILGNNDSVDNLFG